MVVRYSRLRSEVDRFEHGGYVVTLVDADAALAAAAGRRAGGERFLLDAAVRTGPRRRPTVMLFDEFDSIIGYAGEGGDSASQRRARA